LFNQTSNPDYSAFIHKSRYAKYLSLDKRRESWEETVDRYIGFFQKKFGHDLSEVREAIIDLEVMPSMRCLMAAGPALEKDNVAGYNCSYIAVDHPKAFDEAMYVLMCGTGVGFSVERQFISQLPVIAEELYPSESVIRVRDSRMGWAVAFRELISLLYAGNIPTWDVSRIRPAGARLKTFGGRASGPEPLEDLFRFSVELFNKAKGRRLSSIECHDLMCKVADIVVVGGVRRSAMISLSNLSDDRMRKAKSGAWWENNAQRALANNSACYTEKPDFESFLREWVSLYESKSGERGIFNRVASQKQAARNGRRESDKEFGTNPCSEIILRSAQFCNLSEVVVRSEDTLDTLKRKVKLAAIIGTLQSGLTHFPYLRKVWSDNTKEERLLGVSLTGIMDNQLIGNLWANSADDPSISSILEELKDVAIETNKAWSEKLGIEQSTAITCVKPSGTVSQLVDSASGIHPRFAKYYIRRVRADRKDPLASWMVDQGFPVEDDVIKPSNLVFSFPMKAPEGATTVKDVTALDQLNLWEIYQDSWCEHKPSITVYYDTNEEFLDVGAWMYKKFDKVSGVSFLPYSEHSYKQAPYEEIDEEKFNELVAEMPEVDWDSFAEDEDNTTATKELACTAGACEIM
jgi:ribonucleoside-diphosphate reductase alpha chain